MNRVTLIDTNYSNLFNFTNLKISDHFQHYHAMFFNAFTKNKHETRKGKFNEKFNVNLYPDGIYMFKVNNRNSRAMCEICLKLKIKTPERHRRRLSIVDFKQVNPGWVNTHTYHIGYTFVLPL